MIIQGFAAARADREIRRHVREKSGDMVVEIAEPTGAHPNEVWAFVANGILLNVARRSSCMGWPSLSHPVS
jgi:hypothetical protein